VSRPTCSFNHDDYVGVQRDPLRGAARPHQILLALRIWDDSSTTPVMAIYRLTNPIAGFVEKEKQALTIPEGSLIKKDNCIPAAGLTDIGWSGKTVTVAVKDFFERIEPFASYE
jgi:hypothetical protein